MSKGQPALSIGLEEELFLVDKYTGELSKDWPDELWNLCQKVYPTQIAREYLSNQVELITAPCKTIQALHRELSTLRYFLSYHANQYSLAMLGASTHPWAMWQEQASSVSPRYHRLGNALKISAERMLVGGMHIHIGLEDENNRLRLLNAITYYLPVILALSTSSPFWSGKDTGFASYRLSVLNNLPRSGLPPNFPDLKQYHAFLNQFVNSGAIESGRELWWDARLSCRFPTVEVRIADTCTNLNDAMAIAALVLSLASYLSSEEYSAVDTKNWQCIAENRWRAQRYSLKKGSFLLPESNQMVDMVDFVKNLVRRLMPHAKRLQCESYLLHCNIICETGTSADKQRDLFVKALQETNDKQLALKENLDFLIQETNNFESNQVLGSKMRSYR